LDVERAYERAIALPREAEPLIPFGPTELHGKWKSGRNGSAEAHTAHKSVQIGPIAGQIEVRKQPAASAKFRGGEISAVKLCTQGAKICTVSCI
jgi:hypothetical protein